MPRTPPAADGFAALAAVLPLFALAFARSASHVARWEHRMIRETLQAVVWGPERHAGCCCSREEWCIRCEPPCYGCRCRG